MMKRLLFLILFFLTMPAFMAYADAPYKEISFKDLTQFYIDHRATIDLSDDKTFDEYAKTNDCVLYDTMKKDDFRWEKLKETLISQRFSFLIQEKIQLKTPLTLKIDRYNFTTQAFDISPESHLKNTGTIALSNPAGTALCNYSSNTFTNLAQSYELKLDVPFSLYRIPMAQKTAQFLLDNMKLDESKKRVLFATLYMTVDGPLDYTKGFGGTRGYHGVFKGRIDYIDFFMDPSRTKKIKTLRYDAL